MDIWIQRLWGSVSWSRRIDMPVGLWVCPEHLNPWRWCSISWKYLDPITLWCRTIL